MSDDTKDRIDDGGPVAAMYHHGNGSITVPAGGASLRDYFAAMAMQGMLAYSPTDPPNGDYHTNCTPANLAAQAYEYADAMLKARKEGRP